MELLFFFFFTQDFLDFLNEFIECRPSYPSISTLHVMHICALIHKFPQPIPHGIVIHGIITLHTAQSTMSLGGVVPLCLQKTNYTTDNGNNDDMVHFCSVATRTQLKKNGLWVGI